MTNDEMKKKTGECRHTLSGDPVLGDRNHPLFVFFFLFLFFLSKFLIFLDVSVCCSHVSVELTTSSLKFDFYHPVCQAGALVQFAHVGIIFAIGAADRARTDAIAIARAPI